MEFYGEGVGAVPLANRATIGNMSPEFGSTCAIFPVDDITLDYLRLTGRSEEQVALVEAYAREQGLWHDPSAEPRFSERLELDLSTVVPPSPGRSDRRTASSCRAPRRRSARCCRRTPGDSDDAASGQDPVDATHGSTQDEALEETFPASDAPTATATADGHAGDDAPFHLRPAALGRAARRSRCR